MIAPGWRAWAVALSMSIVIHGMLTVSLRQPTAGVKEKPAGTTISVSGSLASIMGVQQSEPTELEKPLAEVEPTTANNIEPELANERTFVDSNPVSTSRNSQPIQPIPSTEVPTVEPIDLAPVTARSVSEAPVSMTDTSEPVEVAPAIPPPAAKLLESKAKEVREQKDREAERTKDLAQQRRQQRVDRERQRRDRVERRRKQEQERRRKQAKKVADRRKAAARAKAGSNQRGQAGTARGGKGGRATASTGSINRYGARVRTRILANRPSTSGAGRTVVSFGLSSNGSLRYARVSRSSGSPRLDQAALIAVRRSSPFPRPPTGATARQRRFSISFSFR